MTVNQRFGLGLISAVAIFGLCQCSRPPTTLEEVIDRNTKAMGGRAALEAVQGVEFDLHIADPTFEVDGTYFAARPGKMRINVSAEGEHVFTEAFDGQKGWQWQRKNNAEKPASDKATATLRHGVELPGKLFGLHEMNARGNQVELIGRENIDGVNYYALRLTLDVDPTPTTIEQRSFDFRTIGGVQFAFASTETDLQSGQVLETTTVRSVKVNPPLIPSIFQTP
jgi:outer membrane lipoprotein-sorting protein